MAGVAILDDIIYFFVKSGPKKQYPCSLFALFLALMTSVYLLKDLCFQAKGSNYMFAFFPIRSSCTNNSVQWLKYIANSAWHFLTLVGHPWVKNVFMICIVGSGNVLTRISSIFLSVICAYFKQQ